MSALDSFQHESSSSPRLTGNQGYTYPVSPTHVSSPPQFDYDYAMLQNQNQNQNPSSPTLSQWNGNHNNNEQRQGLDMFPQDSSMTFPYTNYHTHDSTYLGYDSQGGANGGGASGLSTTPPTASFAATGLPFRGLDYIRNYNGGYPDSLGGDQDSLWQSYDPGAFGYDPDLPFTLLSDIPGENQNHGL